jgi:hypothetical protein
MRSRLLKCNITKEFIVIIHILIQRRINNWVSMAEPPNICSFSQNTCLFKSMPGAVEKGAEPGKPVSHQSVLFVENNQSNGDFVSLWCILKVTFSHLLNRSQIIFVS